MNVIHCNWQWFIVIIDCASFIIHPRYQYYIMHRSFQYSLGSSIGVTSFVMHHSSFHNFTVRSLSFVMRSNSLFSIVHCSNVQCHSVTFIIVHRRFLFILRDASFNANHTSFLINKQSLSCIIQWCSPSIVIHYHYHPSSTFTIHPLSFIILCHSFILQYNNNW